MPAPRESVVDAIVRALTPYLGATMARAATRGHCEKLGIGDAVDPAQVTALLDALRPGLHVFVGRDKTESVVAQVLRELGGQGGPS